MNDTVFVNGDYGNFAGKQMISGDKSSVTITENAILELSDTSMDNMARRYSTRPSEFPNTEIFSIQERDPKRSVPLKDGAWSHCMVGAAAPIHGRTKVQTGEVKYTYGYMGKFICANLLRLFPNGHDKIVMHVGHPISSIGQVEAMMRTVVGRHKVRKVNGEIVQFTVQEVVPFDEPNGGIVNYMVERGAYNPSELKRGDMILVIDIGGGITSLTRVLVERDRHGKLQLLPIYESERSPSFNIGIRNVMSKLQTELKQSHEAFASMKEITDKMLAEALTTHHVMLKGQPVSVKQQVLNSDFMLLDELHTVYHDKLDGGNPFPLIILTGGGSGLMYNSLLEVLQHNNVATATTDPTKLHLANLFGADEIFRQWITRQGV